MIASLRGRLEDKQPNRLVVDVHGVGYEVFVPLSTFYKVGEPGAEVALRIHTHVREDTIALYGFGSDLEQRVFERLIAVSGIGPRLALGVLSGIEPADFVRAVHVGDLGRLTAIPGVGKKTAERMVLELKDRLPQAGAPESGLDGEAGEPADVLHRDLLSALLNLGYHRPPAEKAVDAALKRVESPTFEAVLKQALRELMRG
jgi:Holliday junction DNA helicase RuvA